MAAVVKKKYMLDKVEEENLPYFEITDGKDLVASNQEIHDCTEAKQLIEEAFDSIEDGILTIKLSNKPKAERAKGGRTYKYYEFKVRVKSVGESVQGLGSFAVPPIIKELWEQNNSLQRQLDAERNKRELDNMQRQIDELKNGDNPLVLKGIEALAGILGNKNSVGVAGVDDAPIEQIKPVPVAVRQQKIKRALFRLEKVDTDLANSLELLADFAEAKPEEYKAFIPIIKSQLK